MSKIKKGIIDSIRSIAENGDGELVAEFVFNEGFIGFQGHFPEKKILPGICQILCVTVMMENWKKRPLRIEEIKKVKYFLPVEPEEEVTGRCFITGNSNGNFTVKAVLAKNTDKVAEMSLIFSCLNALKGKTDVATAEQILF